MPRLDGATVLAVFAEAFVDVRQRHEQALVAVAIHARCCIEAKPARMIAAAAVAA